MLCISVQQFKLYRTSNVYTHWFLEDFHFFDKITLYASPLTAVAYAQHH